MNGSLTIQRSEWNSQSADWLSLACDDFYPLDALKSDVESGLGALYAVYDGDDQIAAFVVRVDECAGIHELVIPVLGGYLSGGSLFSVLTPFCEHLAAAVGAQYMRAHTKRRGTAKLLDRAGWERSEVVFRKAISNGQQQ